MCATLFDTDTGLRTDKLCAEQFALAVTLFGVIGDGEDPDADKRNRNGEQRRVLIREDGGRMTEDLHPDSRAKHHQNHGG